MKYLLFLFLIIGCTSIGEDFILEDIEDASIEDASVAEDAGDVEEVKDASVEDASLCTTECLTNSDCDHLGGICIFILTKGSERAICTSDCSSTHTCELGFSCIPLVGATDWNWQCVMIETEVCE